MSAHKRTQILVHSVYNEAVEWWVLTFWQAKPPFKPLFRQLWRTLGRRTEGPRRVHLPDWLTSMPSYWVCFFFVDSLYLTRHWTKERAAKKGFLGANQKFTWIVFALNRHCDTSICKLGSQNERRRSLLEHLLVATLYRAFTLTKIENLKKNAFLVLSTLRKLFKIKYAEVWQDGRARPHHHHFWSTPHTCFRFRAGFSGNFRSAPKLICFAVFCIFDDYFRVYMLWGLYDYIDTCACGT